MNKTTEALKMAIDELERLMETTNIIDCDRYNNALNACKEALESQEQEPVDWASKLREWNECTGALPANGSWFWEVVCMLEEASNTHPAQPLSDDEINQIINKIRGDLYPWKDGMLLGKIARAIEQAHGIGVKE